VRELKEENMEGAPAMTDRKLSFNSITLFLFTLLLQLATCCHVQAAGAQESPAFDPAPSGGGMPGNVIVVNPGEFKGKTLKAGDYLIWIAEKKEGDPATAWPWQKTGPYELRSGLRYKVTTAAKSKIFVRPLTEGDRQPLQEGETALELGNSWLLSMAFLIAPEQGEESPSAAVSGEVAPSRPGAWDGTVSGIYDCGLGKMKISQKGKIVFGTYDWSGGGTICGSMEGNVLTGTFCDKYGSGDIKYTFDAHGFINNWRFTGESIWRDRPRAKRIREGI
jgi:hypothetical protein